MSSASPSPSRIRPRHDDEEGYDDHADPEVTTHAKDRREGRGEPLRWATASGRSSGGRRQLWDSGSYTSSPGFSRAYCPGVLSRLLELAQEIPRRSSSSVSGYSRGRHLAVFPTLVAILIHPLMVSFLSLRRSDPIHGMLVMPKAPAMHGGLPLIRWIHGIKEPRDL